MGSTRTYKIELRMDFDDDSRHDQLTQVMRDLAQGALATAMMLRDNKREPKIALEAGDMFLQNTDLQVADGDLTEMARGEE